MIPILLLILASAQEEQCTLLTDGIVVSKYHLNNCAACVKFNPVYEEIKSRASKEQLNIKFREVECGACDCGDVSRFPTLEITQDKQSKGTSVGYKDYQSFAKWITDTLLLDHNVFVDHIDHEEGKVKTLTASDFLSGFDGQWLILFYDSHKDTRRHLFKELSSAYKNKITVAEVESREAETVMARYNIGGFPFILAINNGTPVPYTGKADFANLSAFAEKLYTPAFQEIKYSELKDITKSFNNGEPVFIVLYKNFEVASYYFNELAQQFKFKATIYRSSDPAMFTAAGYHPKDANEFDKDPDHSQMAYLTVYKNSTFFNSNVKPNDTNEIIQWIFHTHFPHVTNINNDNFYTVFHGIKPVILLLTSNDQLVDSFNKLSATWHLGAAASNIIFATLDTVEYPMFKQEVLKYVAEPGIAFFDPVLSQWYHQPTKLVSETFNKTVMKMIDSYFNKNLPVYSSKKNRSNIYVILGIALVACVFGYRLRTMRNKVD
ncbi:uncharacterized protein VICG_02004 [Vittaforma corneae ATCC 50505]|uniref:Thioredoxin domain-containing protein n=1 Tax=Vittaforma corneae (strain ATCC 50505) TaxID=993615 RepID=L2GK11_VITCO|nr:uncharacterized protein VICG_02004 [Vittaforma corneae ATCC 50505]ELA40974.1 hypothetical protein VICG_02004 [Vittaforma corneae ATCC 50505]